MIRIGNIPTSINFFSRCASKWTEYITISFYCNLFILLSYFKNSRRPAKILPIICEIDWRRILLFSIERLFEHIRYVSTQVFFFDSVVLLRISERENLRRLPFFRAGKKALRHKNQAFFDGNFLEIVDKLKWLTCRKSLRLNVQLPNNWYLSFNCIEFFFVEIKLFWLICGMCVLQIIQLQVTNSSDKSGSIFDYRFEWWSICKLKRLYS